MSITVQLSKEKYIYGVDTHIEGRVVLSTDLKNKNSSIELTHCVFSGITSELIDNYDDNNEYLDELDSYILQSCHCDKNNLSFKFPILQPNIYGHEGVSVDGNYSHILNVLIIEGEELDTSERICVHIETTCMDEVILKNDTERENMTEDEFDEIEIQYDKSRGITIVNGTLISNENYNEVLKSSNIRALIGRLIDESKVLIFLYIFLLSSVIILLILSDTPVYFTVFEYIINNNTLNKGWIILLIITIFVRVFFVRKYRKAIDSRGFYIETRDESDKYFKNCFQQDTIKIKQLFEEDLISPLYPLSISGTIRIGVVYYHEYEIGKYSDHIQTYIDKIIAEEHFASSSNLLEKDISIPKWLQNLAKIQDNTDELNIDINLDITFDGLMSTRETIDLI